MDKKVILGGLIATSSLMLSACAQINVNINLNSANEAGNSAYEAAHSEDEYVGVENPWKVTNPEELSEYYSIYFQLPNGAENVTYHFCEALKMAEADYTVGDMEYDYRIAYTDGLEDITGLYYDWSLVMDEDVNGLEGKSFVYAGEDEDVQAYIWYDPVWKRSSSLSTVAVDLDGYDLRAMVDEVFVETSAEYCQMEYLEYPYWSACYDARYIYGRTEEDNSAVFSFYSPSYDNAGTDVVIISVINDVNYEDVLRGYKEEWGEPDAESIFSYFGADGVESYTYIPSGQQRQASSDSLSTYSNYTAVPVGSDVIVIETMLTLGDDEETSMVINSAFEELLDSFALCD